MCSFEMAWQVFSTVRSLPDVTRRRHVIAYEVQNPITVYVRASHCRVMVQRTTDAQVQIECELRQSFGWNWITERDEAGIYVVLKRKPLVGALSSAALTLVVPSDAYLVFNLTPGSVHLADFDGRLGVAPVQGSSIALAMVADLPEIAGTESDLSA
ncbi:hypothetical protein ACFLYO_07150 [Chloroflexota bacterium]